MQVARAHGRFGRMKTKAQLNNIIASAIQKADSSYFNENYTKQATAVLEAIEKAGYALIPRDLPEDLWKQTADQMKTGRIKPEEHVKDVYQTALRIAGVR